MDAKKRKKNFTMDELRVLREKYADHKDVLISKFNTTVTNKKKKEAWEEITKSVNSLGHEKRDVADVKKKWKNCISDAKMAYHANKAERTKTGGGPAPADITDDQFEIIKLNQDNVGFIGLSDGMETEELCVSTSTPTSVSSTCTYSK